MDDPKQPRHVRAMSVVPVGRVAEKSALPWNAALSVHSDYAAGLAFQYEILGIF